MSWVARFFGRRPTRDLAREVSAHLAERTDDLVETGLSPADARHQAHLEFGNVTLTLEDSRQAWRSSVLRVLDGMRDDGRLAIRRLRARPVASLGAVVTLAASMGAAAATWSLVSAVLLHPFPVRAAHELFVVSVRAQGRPRSVHPYPVYADLRAAAPSLDLAAGGRSSSTELVEINGAIDQRTIFFANRDYFTTLGVILPLGRAFTAEEDQRGAVPTAILSDRLWRQAFDADRLVVGREILVQGHATRIVGVTPAGFRGLSLVDAPDLFMPLHTIGDVSRTTWNPFAEPNTGVSPTAWLTLVVRLHPRMTAVQTAERLTTVAHTALGGSVVLTNLEAAAIPDAARPDIGRFTRLLGTAVTSLLLIGSLSVGVLLLIRTEARRHEFAMCMALGASRSRLARGIVIEGALLAFSGALLALPISRILFAGVRAFQLPGRVSLDLLDLSLDGRVLVGTIVAAVAATLVIAVAAGAFGFTSHVGDALRSRAGATPRLTRRRTRAGLVTAQVAVAMLLVSGAGVLARSLTQALRLNPGYDTAHLLTGGLNLAAYGYDATRAERFFEDLRERLTAQASVRSLALSASGGGMGGGGALVIDGESRKVPAFVEFVGIDARYFHTIGLRLLRGRDFTDRDVAGAPFVAIVSESFGRFLAKGGDPVSHRITEFFHVAGQPPNTIEVVGVVPDVITRVAALEPMVLYRPLPQQTASASRTVVIQAASSPDLASQDFAAAVHQLAPTVTPLHFGMLVLGALGAIAVLLTILGTAVLAESMAHLRQREMSIRAALGATGPELARLVLAETVRLVGVGLAIGLALTWLSAGMIRAFLFRVEPLDVLTLGAVAASLLGVALAVSLPPAVRTAGVDLAGVLREE
jgi:putative ABC transport system permease protein